MHLRLLGGWRLRTDPVAVDYALAGALTVGTQFSIWAGHDATRDRLGAALTAAVITAPIAVRRRWPFAVGTVVPVVSAFDNAVWNAQSVGYPIANFLAMYALAVWTTSRRFLIGITVVAAGALAQAPFLGDWTGATQWVIVTTGVMLLVRRVLGERERRAELAERERDVAAREAVLEERSRIARELHDVIAHNVSMMVVQAGAERRVLDGSGGATREVLEGIERTGRSALTEMRRLVGMLRRDHGDPLAPQPGLDDLPTLVTQVREAGLPVELHVEGERPTVPVGIELSAYRIVQEALTNALKHAGDAHACVRVSYTADSLALEITDDGHRAAEPAATGGHGLVGMRERAALYGGRFTAGRQPGGGFAVRVLLPIR